MADLRSSVARSRIALALIAAGSFGLGACSDEPGNTLARYCTEVNANIETLNNPQIATPTDISATIDLYRQIGDTAPADVAPEWQVMIDSLETASTVSIDDPDSVATANEVALSSQAAATRIQQYTQQHCGTSIGVPPTPTNPVTATTLPPPSTT
ncbi:MAG: hypothetical protein AB7L17_17845 [Ilumatobacteraceae bacterium]